MPSKTPLLLLLDGILSQDQNQISDAMEQIGNIVKQAGVSSPCLSVRDISRIDLTSGDSGLLWNLPGVVQVLLEADPRLASTPSTLDGSLPLHFASSLGNVHVASLLISKYQKAASTPNSKGKIPLHYAAREGRTEMVAFLLSVNPSTASIATGKQKLPLHFAAGEGHVSVVRHLLDAYPEGASVPSSKGKVPLHFAARWGHIEIAEDLLMLYPDGIRVLDWEGSLPLHDAAREGQTQMAQLLIHRYHQGLSTANLRGEIPLFPAVRSANVELVIALLQAWPWGGKHVLKTVCADDDVENWDSDILELCLRGAVGNFNNCTVLDGKRAPVMCHCGEIAESGPLVGFQAASESPHTMSGRCCCDREAALETKTAARFPPVKNLTELHAASATAYAETSNEGDTFTEADEVTAVVADEAMVLVPRSKSPILEKKIRKKRSASTDFGGRKRSRSGGVSDRASDADMPHGDMPREFLALHAALECCASSHVLRCILKTSSSQINKADCFGQLPLHVAMAHSRDKDVVQVVLKEILHAYPQAARVRDRFGRLPLHVGLSSQADFELLKALVESDPSSGFSPCRTKDSRFANMMPLFMATEFDCDLSSTYLLLRGDPSVVQEFVE